MRAFFVYFSVDKASRLDMCCWHDFPNRNGCAARGCLMRFFHQLDQKSGFVFCSNSSSSSSSMARLSDNALLAVSQ